MGTPCGPGEIDRVGLDQQPIPGGRLRFHREGRLGGLLARTAGAGTLPGTVAGAVIRAELLDGGEAFLVVIAAVLVPLGEWLALAGPVTAPERRAGRDRRRLIPCAPSRSGPGRHPGIGGGSILGQVFVGLERRHLDDRRLRTEPR